MVLYTFHDVYNIIHLLQNSIVRSATKTLSTNLNMSVT